jgi:hypothetical protein
MDAIEVVNRGVANPRAGNVDCHCCKFG